MKGSQAWSREAARSPSRSDLQQEQEETKAFLSLHRQQEKEPPENLREAAQSSHNSRIAPGSCIKGPSLRSGTEVLESHLGRIQDKRDSFKSRTQKGGSILSAQGAGAEPEENLRSLCTHHKVISQPSNVNSFQIWNHRENKTHGKMR